MLKNLTRPETSADVAQTGAVGATAGLKHPPVSLGRVNDAVAEPTREAIVAKTPTNPQPDPAPPVPMVVGGDDVVLGVVNPSQMRINSPSKQRLWVDHLKMPLIRDLV